MPGSGKTGGFTVDVFVFGDSLADGEEVPKASYKNVVAGENTVEDFGRLTLEELGVEASEIDNFVAVSYTHLTLPTKRIV